LALALGYFIYQGRGQTPTAAKSSPAISLEETTETVTEPVTEEASIAVIPFLNLSSDKEQEYFSDGLADTILHMLAQIPDLRVAARTSSFKFKDKNEDIREIAAMLGVAMVLEGSVQRAGERVRITAQLVRASDESHVWSNVYERQIDDIFGIQGGVSIPFWRQSLAARVDEAAQLELAAQEAKRETVAAIQSSIGELIQRIPLSWQQLRLLEDILIVQAEESVASAESAYVSGTFNALDLLDAEHVLYRTQTSIARTQADYAIRLARLEGAVARPL